MATRKSRAVAAVTALAAFAAYAAPVVLSGESTFTGCIKLDDTATWLALTDRMMDHGRDLTGLAPSSYEAAVDIYNADGYPLVSSCRWGWCHKLLVALTPRGCISRA